VLNLVHELEQKGAGLPSHPPLRAPGQRQLRIPAIADRRSD
jgi:hypothetical protein